MSYCCVFIVERTPPTVMGKERNERDREAVPGAAQT